MNVVYEKQQESNDVIACSAAFAQTICDIAVIRTTKNDSK